MKRFGNILVCVCWVFGLGVSLPALAQAPAGSFADLRSNLKLKQGEIVQITATDGKKFTARLADISEHSIVVSEKRSRRELTESSIARIVHNKPDRGT